MKITIFAIALISMLGFNLATSLLKVTKKVKNSKTSKKTTSDYGSGSYNDGFTCPDIFARSKGSNFTSGGRVKFYPLRLENPSTPQEMIGWVLDFENGPSHNVEKIVVKISGKKYYLPFRYIRSRAAYTNPVGYKYIEFSVVNDSGEAFTFKVNLPWKRWGWYINDDQGNKICKFLNKRRTEHQNVVAESKVSAVSSANTNASISPILTAQKQTGANLDKEIKASEDKVKALTSFIDSSQTSRKKLEDQYNTLTSDYKEKTAEVDVHGQALKTINSQMQALNDSLKDITEHGNQVDKIIANAKTKSTASLEKLKQKLEILKAKVPSKVAVANNILKAATELKNDLINTNLSSFVPS